MGWRNLTTAGNLVFQGQPDGLFKAYDARTGEELWSYDVGLGISAPPITYKLDGKQMVSLLVGPGGALASNFGGSGELGFESHGWKYGAHERRIMTFSLDGKAVVPEQPAPQLANRSSMRSLKSMPKRPRRARVSMRKTSALVATAPGLLRA